MPDENNIAKIDKALKLIPENQLKVLKAVWDHFLETKEWPMGKRFRKNQGRQIVEQTVANLSPIFIWHFKNRPSEDHYKLTSEGVWAVESFEGPNIKLLLLYLDYLRKRFDEDPDFEKVTAQELRETLNMDSEAARVLGEFLDMGNCRLWGRKATGICTADWEVGVIDDIEILYEANSPEDFLLSQWNENIERIIAYTPEEAPEILDIKQAKVETQQVLSQDNRLAPKELEILFDSANLHHEVIKNSRSLFISNHLSQAIFESLKTLESEIARISEVDSFGYNLITHAFNQNDPKIKLNNINNITEKDEQDGFRFIFVGVMKGIRNPIAHQNVEMSDPDIALKYLCMISLLFEKIDNRVFPAK